MKDYEATILAEYQNSPKIDALLDFVNQWIEPCDDIDNIYSTIRDIATCDDFGLTIWGKIVDVSRYLQIPAAQLYMGYNEANTSTPTATDAQPFGQAPMYNGPPATTTYALSGDAYRKLILVKALANITDCTAPNLNKLLQFLFSGEGRCYVADTGQMAIRYVFEFNLTPVEMAIMVSSGAIPRPAGVLAQIITVDPSTTLGFFEANGQPFGSGVFFNQSEIQNAI